MGINSIRANRFFCLLCGGQYCFFAGRLRHRPEGKLAGSPSSVDPPHRLHCSFASSVLFRSHYGASDRHKRFRLRLSSTWPFCSASTESLLACSHHSRFIISPSFALVAFLHLRRRSRLPVPPLTFAPPSRYVIWRRLWSSHRPSTGP